MTGSATTPPLRGTPPAEGNDSPSLKGWQVKPDAQFPSTGGVARSDGVVVPKLRFSEFRNAGGWITMKLNDACDVNPENSELPGNFAYIDLESVEAGVLKARKIINRDEAPSRAQRLLRYGDVIFQIVRPYQRNNLHFKIDDGVHYVASTGYAQLRANASADFLFQAVHADDFVERVIAKCTGSSYPAINSSDLADIAIAAPSSDEQQKIADCLASHDERITLEAQKLDTLKTHKKGLMQQLFPAEGETLPKLRFPEFREAGEWAVRELRNVFSIFQGFAFSSEDSVASGVRWLKIADVSIQQMNHDAPSYLPAAFSEVYKKFSVIEGDYVIALTRPILSGQLKMAQVDKVFNGALLNQRVGKLVTAQNASFVYFLLQNSKLISDIEKSISGSEPPNLSAQQIENITTCVPSAKEQQKIADCFSSLDDLITAQTQKLAALKTHKKGLMQQLFPSVGGVAGEA